MGGVTWQKGGSFASPSLHPRGGKVNDTGANKRISPWGVGYAASKGGYNQGERPRAQGRP